MPRGSARTALPALAVAALAVAGLLLIVLSGSGGDGSGERVLPTSRDRDVPVGGPARIVGYVRDVNLNPVPGAAVRVAGTGTVAEADEQGRYELRAPEGDAQVVAEHPGYVKQPVRLSERPPGGRLDFSLAFTKRPAEAPDSAHRLIFWTSCSDVAKLSADELEDWIDLGLDGFVCSSGRLEATGGKHTFSGDPGAPLEGPGFELQRALRSSAAARMAKAGELKLYLGFYASNEDNTRTPLMEWFDDEAWTGELLPALRDLAGAARSLGFAGVAIDQELYPAPPDTEASWEWDYPGNERSEEDVRDQVAHRGRQLMESFLEAYPGLELVAYDLTIPESWEERVQEVQNDLDEPFADDVRLDFWDGLSSVQGYAAIHWLDATFYKTPHIGNAWDPALRYNASRVYSLLSRRFSNWPYASSRLHLSPFSWIDEGLTDFQAARDPAYVAEQLDAFSRWGTGGMLANYDYARFGDFDYEPYDDALRRASTPETVEHPRPRLAVGTPSLGDGLELAGTATSALAIRAVRWFDDRGGFGTAELDWDGSVTNWRLAGVPAPAGETRLTIVAEDIKGLATARSLTIAP